MRIVVAINGTLSLKVSGGHEVRIFELFNRLAMENEVHVIQIAENSDVWTKGNLIIHNVKPMRGSIGRIIYEKHYFLARYLYTLKVSKVVRTINPDLVDFNSWVFPLIKRKYKMVATCALMPTASKMNLLLKRLFYSLDLYLLKYKIKKADHLIFLSRQMQDRFKSFITKLGKGFDYVPNGVESEIFHVGDKTKSRENSRLPQNKKIIFFCSRLEMHKRPFDFLEAVKKLPVGYLGLIAGQGSLAGDIENWIIKNNLDSRIILKGPTDKNKLSELYTASDVVVYPGEYEIQPLVPQESMACGTPVIVSNTLGNNEIVSDQLNGLLFELGNVDDLVCKILSLEDNTNLRNKLIENGLQFMRERNWDETAKLTQNIYNKVSP